MFFQTVEFDPMCDKSNPQKISFEDVSAAAFRIQSGIIKTPCVVRDLFSFRNILHILKQQNVILKSTYVLIVIKS